MPHTKTTLLHRVRINSRAAVVVHDLCMVVLAWALASLIRYDFPYSAAGWDAVSRVLPYVVVVQGLILWWSGVYRGLWRFASIPDLWNIMRAVGLGVLAVGLILFLVYRMEGIPRSTLLLYPLFLLFLLSAPRMIYRMWKDHSFRLDAADRKRVLILGAGRSGELLARDMLHDREYLPVGFLDDKAALKGAKVHGVPVLGGVDDLARIVAAHRVDIVVIAMPSANSVQMRRVVGLCEHSGVIFRTLPRLQDLVSGQASLKALRAVAIEDLLGREPVSLDWERISAGLAGKRVLITGAGGSIGAELCRQIARLGAASLVLFERSEFNLYTIEMELRQVFPDLLLYGCLGDVCDDSAVQHVLAEHRPEVIFHAAAYKHVPMLEAQTREAVRNNVIGTEVLALAADRHGCSTFVMISTDKAVNPTSVMGTTKRIAEIFCQNLNRRSGTHFITVRFGNVLGSAGSVVPLFQKQLEAGGPLTVTHPHITRFFMTIPEACQLIMQAGAMGQGGEIYVLDMGEPVSITYLAEQMIRLTGKIPGEDIQIVYTGLRPGEKLYEELFHSQENLSSTEHSKIMLAQCREVDWKVLNAVVAEMEQASAVYDEAAMRDLLKKLVPELGETDVGGVQNVVNLNRRNI